MHIIDISSKRTEKNSVSESLSSKSDSSQKQNRVLGGMFDNRLKSQALYSENSSAFDSETIGCSTEFTKKRKYASLPEYDFERDGSLINTTQSIDGDVLESYWIEPGISLIKIVKTCDFENVYAVYEPSMTEGEIYLLKHISENIRDLLIQKEVNVDNKIKVLYDAIDYLISEYGISNQVKPQTIYKIRYYLKRNFFGLGRIDPLKGDTELEDISCDGYRCPIYVYHKRYRDMRTSIVFLDPKELDSLVVLFAQKSGREISLADPIVDATLTDGSRIQLTYSNIVSSQGSTFSIRKFKKTPYSPIDLINNGTFTIEEMTYIWFAIEYNFSALIIGGTASGKTTTLNAVAQFIPALSKIVSIEDTREITLYHENWIASVVPPDSSSIGGNKHKITMFDLLKAAMRQRPEYILVGEVRGDEAQTLFQAMNTGHTTFSTLHAGDIVAAVSRLQNPPLNIPKSAIQTLDIVITLSRMYIGGDQVRRCIEIVEMAGLTEAGDLEVNTVFSYDFHKEKVIYSGTSEIYSKIMRRTNRTIMELKSEMYIRNTILESMIAQNINDFKDFVKIIWTYSSRQDYVMENIDNLRTIVNSK